MNKTLCTIVFVLFAFLVSCTKSEQYNSKHTLEEAAQLVESNPKQAAALLTQVDPDVLSPSDYWYHSLLQVRLADLTGNNISSSLTFAEQAMGFFTQQNDAEKMAFANFVIAKVYERQDNMVKALFYYIQADEWAEKANYDIKHFNYSSIPYNIAVLLNYKGSYEESLAYCKKRLEYLSDKAKYTSQLYTFELIGLNYENLDNTDDALIYYDKALVIANTNNDSKSKSRIAYNKCILFLKTNEYDVAKKECYKLLPLVIETEVVNKSVLYMVLSDIYKNTNRIDSASICLQKALLNNNSVEIEIPLYKRLYELEQKKGNSSKASAFKEQYLQLQQNKDNARQSETEELKAEISRIKGEQLSYYLVASHKSWLKTQKQKTKLQTVWGAVALSLAFGFVFLLRQKVSANDGVWESTTPEGNDQRNAIFSEKTRYDDTVKLCCRMEYMVSSQLESKVQDFFSSVLLQSKSTPDLDPVSLGGLLVDVWERKNMREILDNNYQLKKESLKMLHQMLPKSYWLTQLQLYNYTYQGVISDVNHKFAWLSNEEKGVLSLLSIRLFTNSEMASLLSRTESEFTELETVLEQKFVEHKLDLKQHLTQIYEANNFKPVKPRQIFLYVYLYQKAVQSFSTKPSVSYT